MAKSNKISILQYDNHLLSRVRLAPSGKGFAVLACDIEREEWAAEDGALAEALTAFVQAHPLEDDRIVSILPRHEVTARILSLPTHEIDEAASMVRLSAEEFVPYSVDDLTIDQCFLEKHPGGEASVLAVLVHKDVIEGHVGILRKAGVVPEQVYLSTACLASASLAARGAKPERYGLVNLGSGGMEVLVMEGGRLLYSRGVRTVQDWSRAGSEATVREELALEVRGSLATYRRESEDGIGVETVYVASDCCDARAAALALAEDTGKDCSAVDFVAQLAGKAPESMPPHLLAALGAGLTCQGKAKIAVELLPASVSRVREIETARRRVVQGAILTGVMLVALGVLFVQSVMQRNTLIRYLEQEVAAIEPNALGVASKIEKLNILQKQVTHEGTALEALATLSKAAPPEGLTITQFRYSRESGIKIYGRVKERDTAFDFAERLRSLAQGSMEFFKNARNLYENESYERAENIYIFHTDIPMEEDENDK